MEERLAPEVNSKIARFVKELAGRHELTAELREGLRGHVEDKIHSYLNDGHAHSEADAFVLAREHLGRPEVIRTLLGVKYLAPSMQLPRRIGGATVATLTGLMVARWSTTALVATFGFNLLVQLTVHTLLFSATAYGLLRFWMRPPPSLDGSWFLRWSRWKIALLMLALFLSTKLSEAIMNFYLFVLVVPYVTFQLPIAFLLVLGHIWVLITVAVWIWWCKTTTFSDVAIMLVALSLLVILCNASCFVVSSTPSEWAGSWAVPYLHGDHAGVYLEIPWIQSFYDPGFFWALVLTGILLVLLYYRYLVHLRSEQKRHAA